MHAPRKVLTEPVFAFIKRARHFRRFLLRGLIKIQSKWALICTGHNFLTLFRSGRRAKAWAEWSGSLSGSDPPALSECDCLEL